MESHKYKENLLRDNSRLVLKIRQLETLRGFESQKVPRYEGDQDFINNRIRLIDRELVDLKLQELYNLVNLEDLTNDSDSPTLRSLERKAELYELQVKYKQLKLNAVQEDLQSEDISEEQRVELQKKELWIDIDISIEKDNIKEIQKRIILLAQA